MANSTYLQIRPLDPLRLFETQVDNIFKPLKNPTAIFVPAQYGGPLNQLALLSERDALTFMEVRPGS